VVSTEAGVSADGGDPLLQAKGITVDFGDRRILECVDIAVRAGEIVTLIGPNGSGKTTLVRVVLGHLKPGAGAVRRRAGLTIGYLPQRFVFDTTLPLTVRGFLDLPKPRPEPRLREALAEVGVAETLNQAVQELSGGELQRLLLARALLREPDLLVLDEPLQGVDFGGQIALFQLIAEVRRRRGCGVLMVSHDLHLVMAGTDRVVCLNRHVCCSGAPDSVSRHPEYLSLFGPKAAEGLAVYAHDHDHKHELSGDVTVLPKAAAPGEQRLSAPDGDSGR
jgi:zinc transport system ATP-binding protein